VEYTNGEETGLNKYETKVSWKITMGGSEGGFGKVRSGQVMTVGVSKVAMWL